MTDGRFEILDYCALHRKKITFSELHERASTAWREAFGIGSFAFYLIFIFGLGLERKHSRRLIWVVHDISDRDIWKGIGMGW